MYHLLITCLQLVHMSRKNDKDLVADIIEEVIRRSSIYYEIEAKYPQIIFKDKFVEEIVNCKIKMDVINFINDLELDARRFYNQMQIPSYPIRPFEGLTEFQERLNKNILSITMIYWTYKGGAHGDYKQVSYNYNMKNCRNLKLRDLFYNGYDYITAINKEINRQISENKEEFFTGELGFTTIDTDQSFYLEPDNLVIYFNLYEIAPYVKGIPEFKIPYDYFNNNLKINID